MVTVDHEITVDGVEASQTMRRFCCSAAVNCGPTGTFRDSLIYERGAGI